VANILGLVLIGVYTVLTLAIDVTVVCCSVVALRQTRLVLRWVIAFGRVNHLGM